MDMEYSELKLSIAYHNDWTVGMILDSVVGVLSGLMNFFPPKKK